MPDQPLPSECSFKSTAHCRCVSSVTTSMSGRCQAVMSGPLWAGQAICCPWPPGRLRSKSSAQHLAQPCGQTCGRYHHKLNMDPRAKVCQPAPALAPVLASELLKDGWLGPVRKQHIFLSMLPAGDTSDVCSLSPSLSQLPAAVRKSPSLNPCAVPGTKEFLKTQSYDLSCPVSEEHQGFEISSSL